MTERISSANTKEAGQVAHRPWVYTVPFGPRRDTLDRMRSKRQRLSFATPDNNRRLYQSHGFLDAESAGGVKTLPGDRDTEKFP